MTTPDPVQPEPGPDADIDEIQADIEATRHQVGETVGALTEKLDVKKQASQKVADTRARVAGTAQSMPPAVPIAAVVAVLAVIGLMIWRRRRR